MKPTWFAPLLALAALLTACREDPLPSDYASRAELRDSQSQFLLARFAGNPGLTLALQEVYGEVPAPLQPQVGPLPVGRLDFIKAVAWGTAEQFESVERQRELIDTLHPGLDWKTDGCSTPPGVNFGYHEAFRPACLVHDFGYHNLRVMERTPGNREKTDLAFYANMKSVCNRRLPPERPSCYVVAFVYEEGVRIGGVTGF
jgi:Prokaryotic phospholipase A2